MPSGYTAKVETGEISSLEEYALECVRGMGVYIEYRDDPNAPLPKRLTKNTFYNDQLIVCEREIEEWHSKPVEEVIRAFAEVRENELRYEQKNLQGKIASRNNYEAMLEKANAWVPPNDEYNNFKELMVEQLENSIKFDCPCPISDYEQQLLAVESILREGIKEISVEEAEKYRSRKIEDMEWAKKHYEESDQQETEKVNKRNLWLDVIYGTFNK